MESVARVQVLGEVVCVSLCANTLGKTSKPSVGVIVKVMDCGIVVREFVLQSRHYIYFRANTRGKTLKPSFWGVFSWCNS